MYEKKNKHIGKKTFYALVIAMSVLVIFACGIFTISFLVVSRPLGNMVVSTLQMVENAAKTVQMSADKVDGRLASLEVRTLEISDATEKISQNVTDKGLLLTLLPEEREQQLTADVTSMRATFSEIRSSIKNGVELYRSINAMPFINLPSLDEDQLEKIQESLEQTQVHADSLRSDVADVRAGVTERVDKLQSAANNLTERIQIARERIARLDSRMAELEALSIRLQAGILKAVTVISVVVTVLAVFVIWAQVELIKKYRMNWRLLNQDVKPVLPPEKPDQPVEASMPPVQTPVPSVEPPTPPEKKPAKPTKKTAPSKPAKAVKKTKPAKPSNKKE